MNDFIKGWGHVCLGSLAGAALGAACFFAIEALMPQPADAASVHLECKQFNSSGDAYWLMGVSFNEDKLSVSTRAAVSQEFVRDDDAAFTHDTITFQGQSDSLFSYRLNRKTGELVISIPGAEVGRWVCSKADPAERTF